MERSTGSESGAWVDRQLAAALRTEGECAPDTERGLQRLQRVRAARRLRRRRQAIALTGLAVASALVTAVPATRVYAVRCVDSCIAGGEFVLSKLRSEPLRTSGRRAAPDFALTDANGATVRLSALRGEVVVLNFWATWCQPCRMEIPWFVEFQRQYAAQGFRVVGVSFDEDGWTAVRPFAAERRVNYPLVVGNDAIAQAYGGVETLPATLIIDRQGRVAATHVGLVSRAVYERDISVLLAEPR